MMTVFHRSLPVVWRERDNQRGLDLLSTSYGQSDLWFYSVTSKVADCLTDCTIAINARTRS